MTPSDAAALAQQLNLTERQRGLLVSEVCNALCMVPQLACERDLTAIGECVLSVMQLMQAISEHEETE